MGSCISAPSKPVSRSVSSKKKKRRRLRIRRKSRTEDSLVRKPEEKLYLKSLIDEDAAYAYNFRKSVASKQLFVIEDAIEEDIHEQYVFGKELGRGEFGITYPICDKVSNERFACKIIRKSKLKTETDIEDVRREVQIMRQLPKHPNIVRLREVYENKNAVFLVMELCEGGELFDRIVQRGHYTERAAALVTKTIVEIVKVCHQHGVIHRDLKPENFLFQDQNENSQLKAIDFGLSIFFEPGQRFSEIVGSPYYMAPEVLRRNYGPEIDVWSAGIILYILLCGVPPFWAETEEGIAHAIVRSEIDFERDPWSKVSEDAKDLVKSMLDPNPYSRLTVEEVLEHPWIQNANEVSDVSLGENVRTRIRHFSLVNKFKKRVLEYVADNLPLSTEKIHKIKEIVDKMDTDKNGNLTFQELRGNHPSIGQVVPDPDVNRYLEAADGHCTRNHEDSMIMSVCLKRINSDKHLKHAFFYFDKDKNGYIEFEELREALRESKQVIQDIIFDVDLDEDGRISYDEFKQMMKSGMDWKMASRQYSRAMLTAVSLKLFKD